MKKSTLAALLAILAPMVVATPAILAAPPIGVESIGYSTSQKPEPDQEIIITPIWSIRIGNPGKEEAATLARNPRWQPYSINGTIFTPAEHYWVKTSYRMPENIAEATRWKGHPAEFITRLRGNASILPTPLGKLETKYFTAIDEIIEYKSGLRINLKTTVTEADALAFADAVEELLTNLERNWDAE